MKQLKTNTVNIVNVNVTSICHIGYKSIPYFITRIGSESDRMLCWMQGNTNIPAPLISGV